MFIFRIKGSFLKYPKAYQDGEYVTWTGDSTVSSKPLDAGINDLVNSLQNFSKSEAALCLFIKKKITT